MIEYVEIKSIELIVLAIFATVGVVVMGFVVWSAIDDLISNMIRRLRRRRRWKK